MCMYAGIRGILLMPFLHDCGFFASSCCSTHVLVSCATSKAHKFGWRGPANPMISISKCARRHNKRAADCSPLDGLFLPRASSQSVDSLQRERWNSRIRRRYGGFYICVVDSGVAYRVSPPPTKELIHPDLNTNRSF